MNVCLSEVKLKMKENECLYRGRERKWCVGGRKVSFKSKFWLARCLVEKNEKSDFWIKV